MALAVGGALIFWRLTDKSLFIDEAFSLAMARLPVAQLFRAAAYRDVHPPLFYLFARGAVLALRWPAPDYRYLTAPFGLVTIAAVWALVRRSFGDAAAGLAALFVATAPTLVGFDRIFRMYAPLAALTTASWWVLCCALEARGARAKIAWLAYFALAIALPYTQYLGWFVVASQTLFALVRRPVVWPVLVGTCVAALAFIPWWWALRIQYPAGAQLALNGGITFDWAGIVRAALTNDGMPPSWTHGFALDALFSISTAGVLAAALWLGRTSMLPFWLLPIALQLLVSAAAGKNLAVPRYFVYLLPAVAAAFAVATAALLRTPARVAGVALAGLVLFVNGVSLSNTLLVPAYQTPDWYAADLLLAKNERPGDAFVFDQGMPLLIMQDYATVRGHRAYAVDSARQLPDALRWLDRRAQSRVWYVANQAFNADPHAAVLKALRASRPQLGFWVQPHVAPEDVVYLALFGPKRR